MLRNPGITHEGLLRITIGGFGDFKTRRDNVFRFSPQAMEHAKNLAVGPSPRLINVNTDLAN